MKKIKVDIMTNKSYPKWKVINSTTVVNEKEENYLWEFEALKNLFQDSEDEYPCEMIIEHL